MPSDNSVILKSPLGETQRFDDLGAAQNAIDSLGFTEPTPEDIQAHTLQEQYGGVGSQIATGLESAASMATFGGSRDIEKYFSGNPQASQEAQAARAKANPISHGVGTVAGIVLPLLAGDAEAPLGAGDLLNPVSGLSKIGRGATEGAAAFLGPSESVAAQILKSGASHAIGSAIEGAAYGLGQSVDEDALGDPDAMGQKLIGNIGMSALWAGGIGGALGMAKGAYQASRGLKTALPGEAAISETEQATPQPKPIPEIIAGIKDDMSQIPNAAGEAAGPQNASTVEGMLDGMDMPASKKQSVLDGLRQLKPNAQEIQDAGKLLGAPVLESQISASKHVQDLDSMLMQSPTIIGVNRQQLLQKGFDSVKNAVEDALGSETQLTAAEAGNAIKEGITAKLTAETKPITALYDELKTGMQSVPVNPTSISRIASNIMDIENIGLRPSSPEFQFAKGISEELSNIETVDQIKEFKSSIARQIMGNPELRHVGGIIQDKLAALEENTILRNAEHFMPERAEEIRDLVAQRAEANLKYTALREKMGELGDVLGKRKIYGPQDFLNFVDDMTPEKLSDKLFAKKNSEFLSFFKEQFPDEFKILADLQKNGLREKGMEAGLFAKPNTVLREVNKLSPEVRSALFTPEQLDKLEAAKTWTESLPKNINPSGTSKAEAYRRFFTNPITAAAETARDAATSAAMKHIIDTTGGANASKINALVSVERTAQKTVQQIVTGAKAVFQFAETHEGALVGAGSAAIQGNSEDQTDNRIERLKTFENQSTEIASLASNPQALVEKLNSSTAPLFDHAPKITGALQQNMVQAVNFLNSKIPQAPSQLPLSRKWVPSQTEISKFNNYYQAVNKPISVLKEIKNGTLMPEHVEAVMTTQPKLYQAMVGELTNQMASQKKDIPYRTKLMLGLFMGQDLDESTVQTAIALNQQTLAGNINAPSPQGPQRRSRARQMDKMTISQRALTPLQATSQRASGES